MTYDRTSAAAPNVASDRAFVETFWIDDQDTYARDWNDENGVTNTETYIVEDPNLVYEDDIKSGQYISTGVTHPTLSRVSFDVAIQSMTVTQTKSFVDTYHPVNNIISPQGAADTTTGKIQFVVTVG